MESKTLIYSCRSNVTVNFTFPLMTNMPISNVAFRSINDLSSFAYSGFIPQLIRDTRACSTFDLFCSEGQGDIPVSRNMSLNYCKDVQRSIGCPA